MKTIVESDDTVKEGKVGLVVVAGIVLFLFAWFVPSVGVLFGLAVLAAMAVAVVILALTYMIAACEAIFSGSRRETNPQTVQIKRRAVGV